MNETNNDTNMTGNADNGRELRTNCGHCDALESAIDCAEDAGRYILGRIKDALYAHQMPYALEKIESATIEMMGLLDRWKKAADQPTPRLVQLDKDGIVRPVPWDCLPTIVIPDPYGDGLDTMPGEMVATTAPSGTTNEILEIRTCFMGAEFGEIEAVPLFRYRELQRQLAQAKEANDGLKLRLAKVREKLSRELAEAQGNAAALKDFENYCRVSIRRTLDDVGAPFLHPDIGAPARKPMMSTERIKALAAQRNALKEAADDAVRQRDTLAEALTDCLEDSEELLAERDWWKDEPRGSYQKDHAELAARVEKARKALAAVKDPTTILGMPVVINEAVPNDTVIIQPPQP